MKNQTVNTQELKKHSTLNLDDQQLLADVKAGDMKASDELVRIACSKKFKGADKDDVYQIAHLSLLQAVELYKPDQNRSFKSFAIEKIFFLVSNSLQEQGQSTKALKHPCKVQRQQIKLQKIEAQLMQKLMRQPKLSELADAMEMDINEVSQLMAGNQPYTELEDVHLIPDTTDIDLQDLIQIKRSALSEQANEILTMINDFGMTKSEVSKLKKVTPQRVGQIYSKAIRTLKSRDDGQLLEAWSSL